jgi:hypothetical protein
VRHELLDTGARSDLHSKAAASPLHACVAFQDVDAARALLVKWANPDYQHNVGLTPFHVAFDCHGLELARLLYTTGEELGDVSRTP